MPRSATNGLAIIPIDVSELEPPEPMEQILARLRRLQPGQLLRVQHRREPFPLYPMLKQAGYKHYCIPSGTEAFLIYIWPHSTPVTEAFCQTDSAAVAR